MLEIYGIIYKVVNKINKKLYIGLTTKSLEDRKIVHFNHSKYGSKLYFHNAIRKYGKENYEWSEIDSADTKEDLIYLEKYWIHFWNTNKQGYNLTLGGDGIFGYKHTEENKENIGKAHLGNTYGSGNKGIPKSEKGKENMRKAKLGNTYGSGNKGISKSEECKANMRKPKSEEHKANMRKAHLGKPLSEEHKANLRKARLLYLQKRKQIGFDNNLFS